MPRYKITTLVDITRTNATRSELDKKRISQQANFNSLIQAAGLRANLFWNDDPKKYEGRLPDPFEGKGTFWIWEFEVEREDIFLSQNDPVMLLKEDLNGVPIISSLDDTADLSPPVFNLTSNKINTVVEII